MTETNMEFARGMRESYSAQNSMAGAADAVSIVRTRQIPASGPDREIRVREYRPTDSDQILPLIIFIHGGGFVSGDLETHDVLARALALGVSATVLAVDYRLAPENPFPAGLDDVSAVSLWARAHAEELRIDPTRIVIGGDSAGGNLAPLAVAQARDTGQAGFVAQFLFYPLLDFRTVTDSWARLGDQYFPTHEVMRGVDAAYLGPDISLGDPRISPLLGSVEGMPPTILAVGTLDPLLDDSRQFATLLEAAGIPTTLIVSEDATHGYIQYFKDPSGGPAGREALERTITVLREVVGKNSLL